MKKIRLFLTGLLLAVTAAAYAQDITVTGTVTDASTGESIIGASVVLKGNTTVWTMTDELGQYSLTVPSNGVLEVSFMGYLTQEIPVNGRASINVELELDAQMLEDVIVVGYGTARKITSVVGSASTVKNDVVMNRPSANVGDALQGQVSGLQIFSSTGEPMSNVSMRLRGVNSINASSTPLFVLDGTPVSADIFNALNSNDIESMVVMKDASSTSIYGSRAANGVIYITTKKGSRTESKPVVKLTGQYGISTIVNHKMQLMNSEQWFQFNEMVNPDFEMTEDMKIARELGINTDWLDYLFNETAPVWNVDLSISGASDRTDYYISLGTFNQTGTAPDSFLSRYNIRSNINTRVTDWLKFGVNLGLTYQSYRSGPYTSSSFRNSWQNPINLANWGLPWTTPYAIKKDGDSYYVDYNEEPIYIESLGLWNPYFMNELQPSTTTYARLYGNTYIELTPVKGLTLKAQQGLEAYDYRSQSKVRPMPANEGPWQSGNAGESFSRYYQFTFTNTAEYRHTFAQKHNFALLLGQESIFDNYEGFGVSVTGLTDWRNNLVSQAPQSGVNVPSYSFTETAYNSYFARLSYDFDEKYYIDVSWRLDGSSLFGLDRQYANFYSVGAQWDILKEPWMRGASSWLQDLRLKASYGTTGNSGISTYLAYGTIGNYGGDYFDAVKGWGLSNPGNTNLTWETVETLNIGVVARLWNFMGVTVEFYNKMTRDLLMEIPFSFTTGHSGGWGNAGDMMNRGVDVDLSFDIVQTKDLYFGISANFNYNRNEITELFGGRDEYTIANTGISYQTGYPYGEFFYVRSAGVDPADGMQVWYDLDGNKTKNFSDSYAVMLGKQRYAPWSGGIQLSFQYKGLYVGADFSWVAGKWTINNDKYFLTNPAFSTTNMNGLVEMLDIWTEPGQITDVPGINSQRQFDETFLENASFLRLKNLQIGYEFPEKWMKRTGFIEGFRVYFIGRNLLTFTEYKGYDPEVDSNLQLGVYPNSRQFTVGAEFTF